MAIIKVSDLPQKATLEATDRVVGYSTTGGTSLLAGQAFIDLKNSAENAVGQAWGHANNAAAQNAEITTKIEQAKNDIESAKWGAINTINSTKDGAIGDINWNKDNSISQINSAKTGGVSAVGDARNAAIGAVQAQQAASISAVQSAQAAASAELTTALRELIVEFGGQVPA